MAEETKIFNIKINYEDFDRYRDAMVQALGTYDDNIAKLNELNAEIAEQKRIIADEIKAYNAQSQATRTQSQAWKDAEKALREYTTQKQQLQQILKNEEKLNQATIGSYQKLDAMVGRMSMAWRKMNEQQREVNAELPATINAMRDQLKAADASIGNFQRNVGNYASGWNGLNVQLQQVVRELPSLSMGANQFFLAISNNLPMFADEIQRAAKANKELKAEGKATTPVFTQLVKSLFSWQTALVVGITLLSTYGKEIAEWARQLLNGKNAVDYLNQSLGQMTGSVMAERVQLEAMFSALRNAKEGTAEYALARQNIIDKYGSLLNNQAKEIKNLQDIDGAYKALMSTMSAKAIIDASMKQMTEAAEKFSKKINDITGDIRDKFGTILVKKGYGSEQINQLFGEFINGITSNEPRLKAKAEEIIALFDYDVWDEATGNMETHNYLRNAGWHRETDLVEKLMGSLSDYQTQAEAVTESSKIMANAFGVDADAFDALGKKAKENGKNIEDIVGILNRLYAKRDELLKQQHEAESMEEQARIVAEIKNVDNLIDKYDLLRKKKEKASEPLEGSIAKVQAEIAEAEKNYANATSDQMRTKWKEAIDFLKNKLHDLENGQIGLKMVLKINADFDNAIGDALASYVKGIGGDDKLQSKMQKAIDETGLGSKVASDMAKRNSEKSNKGLSPETQQIISATTSAFGQMFSTIEQMQQKSIQRRLQDELDALNRETDSKKQALKAQQENGVISQKTYERKLNEIDKEAAAKQEELKKEAFNKQKKWNIAQALMNGGLAITNIWAQNAGNPIMAAILTALSIATTAAQVATISSQKYARGGLLHGKSHAQGGIKGYVEDNPIELEGGETVINKRSSRLFARELSAINSYNGWGVSIPSAGAPKFKRDLRFARGGVLAGYDFSPAPLPMSAAQVTTAQNEQRDKSLLQAIGAMVDAKIYNIRTTVLWDDIDNIGNEKRTVVSRATL